MVQIAYKDAEAYAQWAGKELPTEAEWEFAARGGLEGAEFAWGDEFTPGGKHMANTWQGNFPLENEQADGFARTSPVRAFPANGYGVYDMIGNTWEWTSDWYSPKHAADAPKACCIPENPRGAPIGGQLRSAPADDPHSAQGAEGRLASLRAELLPALSAGRAPRRADRHVDQPRRLPLRHARQRMSEVLNEVVCGRLGNQLAGCRRSTPRPWATCTVGKANRMPFSSKAFLIMA